MPHVEQLIPLLVSQTGDDYVFGAEASPSDPDPPRFDCSELIEWGCARMDVTPRMPDGSKNQKAHCDQKGTLIPVDRAMVTRGALLFRMTGSPTHVVMSLGDGNTIEARGSAFGVGVFKARDRGWTHGALVPGLDYESQPPVVVAKAKRVIRRLLVPGGQPDAEGRLPLWSVFSDGSVHTSHGAPFHGALPAGPRGLNIRVDNIVDLLPHGAGGYWLVGAEGAIYSFGDAPFFGSLPGLFLQPAAPVSELQQRPDGQDGYVLVAEDDGTFAFPL